MLGVRPKHDATNGYRTDTRMPYLSKSDTMIMRERIIWKKKFPPPSLPPGRFRTKNKKKQKTQFDESNSENSRLFKMFFWGFGTLYKVEGLNHYANLPTYGLRENQNCQFSI